MQHQVRNCLQIIVKNNGWNVVNSYYTVCGLSTLLHILKFYAYSNEVVLFLCQFSRKENRSLERWRNQPEVTHQLVHLCFDLTTGSSVPEPVLLITLLHCLSQTHYLAEIIHFESPTRSCVHVIQMQLFDDQRNNQNVIFWTRTHCYVSPTLCPHCMVSNDWKLLCYLSNASWIFHWSKHILTA